MFLPKEEVVYVPVEEEITATTTDQAVATTTATSTPATTTVVTVVKPQPPVGYWTPKPTPTFNQKLEKIKKELLALQKDLKKKKKNNHSNDDEEEDEPVVTPQPTPTPVATTTPPKPATTTPSVATTTPPKPIATTTPPVVTPPPVNLASDKIGIAVAGLEFAEGVIPGANNQNYKSNGLAHYQKLADAGFKTYRLPFLTKRLGGTYNQYLIDNVAHAKSVGGKVWLDFHDYGRSPNTATRVEIANLFKNDSTVEAMEIDNEPHSGNISETNYWNWVKEVVPAIEATGWNKTIAIPMFNWSSMDDFVDGKKDMTPPFKGDRYVYVFHNYFNKGNTGFNHPTNPDENAQLHVDRLNYVIAWAKKHGVKIAITEFGVPPKQNWVDNAKPFSDTLKANSDTVVKSFLWSAGEWYNSDTVYKDIHKPLH